MEKDEETCKTEIIDSFPVCDKIGKNDIRALVELVFQTFETYHEIYSKVHDYCQEIWPRPENLYMTSENGKRERTPEYKKWIDYFYGLSSDENTIDHWVEKFKKMFVEYKGKKREFSEACSLAASKWHDMIFGEHHQNNGSDSIGCQMAQIYADGQKNIARHNTTLEIREKFLELMTKFYENDCIVREKGHEYQDIPDVDYGPNLSLKNILRESGVPEQYISAICPWKTCIIVDKLDNTVIIHEYRKETIL